MTTLTIAAVDTAGHPLAHRTVEVAVIAGRPGGHPAAGGPVIAAPVQVRLDEDGTGEVDVDPTDTLDAPGAFVRCTVLGSSPTIVRSLTIPTGPSTVDWADPDLQVADPVIPEVGITRRQLDEALDELGPSGPPLSDASPQPPGAASPGSVSAAARGDHVHPPPTAGQIGAATAADIAAAVAGRQPLDSDLTAIAALATTSWGRALLTLADAAAARTVLGVVPGVDVQPADPNLTAIAALATTSWGRALLTLADAAAARAVLDAAATGHVHDASAITTGVVAAARLGSGTASVGTVLTGAGTWTSRGYKLIAGQPYDGAAVKAGTAVTTQNRVAWTTLEGLALGAQVDALWVDVTTGGSTGATVQLSLLADDGYGRPGALLAQTAQLPAETSTAIVMGTFTAVTLTTSTIHIGVHVRSTAQPTLRVISSRATCIPAGPASTSNTMAWYSTIAGVAVGSNPAVDVSSAACYRAGIRGA